jgi:transcriptional regulator with PAS, ATPase and Fis domain
MNPNRTIVFVTSIAAQREDFYSSLPWGIGRGADPLRIARQALEKGIGTIVFCPPDWPAIRSLPAARELAAEWSGTEVVIISTHLKEVTLQAVRANLTGNACLEHGGAGFSESLKDFLSRADALPPGDEALVGTCRAFVRLKELIRRFAPVDMTVLITGETGTGKELVARAIHRLSRRRQGPFVSVNCAAIPEGLIESELFGHERGAFTGAMAKQPGKLRLAHGGTIFLDEIADMSLSAQAKILRALESREVEPVGGNAAVPIDVRVVAATHQDLHRMMREQSFRTDLFFRLSVLPVVLPPLRERQEDIAALTDHFIQELNARYGRDINGVDPDGIALLRLHDWPGNIRELRNVIEGAYLVCESGCITPEDLQWFKFVSPPRDAFHAVPGFSYLPAPPEPDRLLEVLQATRWNKSQAARRLQWSRMTLYRKIAKYHLIQEDATAEVS